VSNLGTLLLAIYFGEETRASSVATVGGGGVVEVEWGYSTAGS